ncbi:MAG: sigma factor-like helix-turn-helix DNA-binding protein, partial [Candidatus Omnitrophota bacterium]|nr:sigma factor-like helix-turn-helix DNA-binding protein [Candidatus Omnitrophota bacterium]
YEEQEKAKNAIAEIFDKYKKRLNRHEQYVLKRHYLDADHVAIKVIAEEMGYSESHVSQLCTTAIDKLRKAVGTE